MISIEGRKRRVGAGEKSHTVCIGHINIDRQRGVSGVACNVLFAICCAICQFAQRKKAVATGLGEWRSRGRGRGRGSASGSGRGISRQCARLKPGNQGNQTRLAWIVFVYPFDLCNPRGTAIK